MRRCIALVLCIALCFGLLAVPSSAMSISDAYEYTAVTLWNAVSLGWEYIKNGFAWLGDLVAPFASDLSTAYNSYVSDVRNNLGSSVIDGITGYPRYISSFSRHPANGSTLLDATAIIDTSVGSFHVRAKKADAFAVRYVTEPFYICSYGTYKLNYLQNISSGTFDGLSVSWIWQNEDGSWPEVGSSVSSVTISSDSNASYLHRHFRICISFIPASVYQYSEVYFSDVYVYPTSLAVVPVVSSSSRATSMFSTIMQTNTTNNAYYIGTKDTNGAVNNVYTTNIFNEDTNVFTVPGETPVTYNITNWNYDYSTRTYNCTDGTNNYSVTYGDDHITVTVPDGGGGTTSTNYYYVHQTPVPTPAVPGSDTTFPDSSSDNYEDDPNTTGGFFSTVWKAFKDGLASLIAGIIKALFKGIKALIDGITSVFSGLVSGFFDFVTSFFGSFGTGPGQVGQFFGGGVTDLD